MWNFLENNWLGLVTVVGVALTMWQVIKTRKAADAAAASAKKTKEDLNKNFLISDLSTALATIEEITFLNRQEKWEIVLDRYSRLRGLLVNIKTQGLGFISDDKRSLQDAIVQVRVIEEAIEESIVNKTMRFDRIKYNKILSEIADNLNSIVGKEKLDLSRGA